MPNSFTPDPAGAPHSRPSAFSAVRLTDTDAAIVEALAAPYIAGKAFPTPAPNNRILEAMSKRHLDLDLDTLRTHLRGLYQKFGVEEGLNPAEKRVRLCELV